MDLRKQSAVIFSSEAANSILGFVAIVLFAREIGATQMGIFFLFQAVIGIIAIPTDLGLRGAIEKRISEGQPANRVLTTAVLLKMVPATAIIILIFLFGNHFNNYIGSDVALYLTLGLILKEFAGVVNHVLIGEMRAEHSGTIQFARQVVWIASSAIFVFLGFEANALIWGLLAGWTFKFLLGWHLSLTSFGMPTLDCAQSLLAFAKYNSISFLQSTIYRWMDVAIIGLFLTPAHVGAYEIAWRVAQTVIILSQAISIVILPQISKWSAEGQFDQIEQLISDTITPALFFIIPIFVGSIFVSQPLLTHVFGAEYAIASVALVILLGERHFHALFEVFRRSLLGIDRPDLVARAILVTLALNLSINLLLVQIYGINGVAFGTAASFFMSMVLHWYYLSRFLTVQLPLYELGWCMLSATGMAAVLMVIQLFTTIHTLSELIGIVAIGGAVYILIAFIYKPFREQIYNEIRTTIT